MGNSQTGSHINTTSSQQTSQDEFVQTLETFTRMEKQKGNGRHLPSADDVRKKLSEKESVEMQIWKRCQQLSDKLGISEFFNQTFELLHYKTTEIRT